MATAQTIIDAARYDLVDFTDGVGVGIEFDDAELLHYLNRMIQIMDATLQSLESDLVEAEETDIDTVLGQNYVDLSSMNSGLWSNVRSVYLGSSMLDKVSLKYMRYTRFFRTGNARPTIWCLYRDQILLPQGADAAHTDLVIYYDQKQAALTLSSNMPYSDRFNEFLREMLVMCAKAKKEGILDKADAALNQMFHSRAMQEEISRGFIPRTYNYMEF
jgi:hypothetical protein